MCTYNYNYIYTITILRTKFITICAIISVWYYNYNIKTNYNLGRNFVFLVIIYFNIALDHIFLSDWSHRFNLT